MRQKYISLFLISSLLLSGCAQTAAPQAAPSAEPPPTVIAVPTVTPNAAPSPAATAGIMQDGVTATPESMPSPTPTDYDRFMASVETDPNRPPLQKLKEAVAVNNDVIGWIEIPNTTIDAPILFDKQWFYADHNIRREPDSEGCVISHYSILTRNTILQGKNMRKSGGGLHDLHKLQDNAALLAQRENRICFIDIHGLSEWEIFALYETTSGEPAETLRFNIQPLGEYFEGGEADKWVAYQKERSELKDIIDVPVTGSDILMTIMTGGDNYEHSDTQSRLYVFLKAVG